MRPALQLYSTLRQVETLFAEEDRPRSSARTVAVDRQSLKNVLMDHQRLTGALRDHGRVIDGVDA
jgi:hypothetical protein